MSEACCTCATLLVPMLPSYDGSSEKKSQSERRLECCGRIVCAQCLMDNQRFATYCPFCQISTSSSSLPKHGLRDPPAYSPPRQWPTNSGSPPSPSYTIQHRVPEKTAKHSEDSPDVLHFVDQDHDSVKSLPLRYGVPPECLRRTNNLYADYLLAARRTVLIPGEYYKGGISLSPRPPEGEEGEIKKVKVRKFMVGCKVAEYDIALLYLGQASYHLDEAMAMYRADEQWEKEHALEAARKFKTSEASRRQKWGLGGLAGQIS